jgi:hypothetical protein
LYNTAILREKEAIAMGDKSPKNKEKRKPKKAGSKKAAPAATPAVPKK